MGLIQKTLDKKEHTKVNPLKQVLSMSFISNINCWNQNTKGIYTGDFHFAPLTPFQLLGFFSSVVVWEVAALCFSCPTNLQTVDTTRLMPMVIEWFW